MRIAQYQGKSIESRVIRWVTRSQYSHSCFVFDEQTTLACKLLRQQGIRLEKLKHIQYGAVVEAWNSGVRNVHSISAQHTPRTKVDILDLKEPLTLDNEMKLVCLLNDDIGDKYDWTNVIRFITRKPGTENADWFCSENVFQRLTDVGTSLFARTHAWEVPPALIPRSPLLSDNVTHLTTI